MILNGLAVHVTEYAVTTDWIFPKHRFVEYEEKDEPLCRKYGIGHDGPTKPAAFAVGGELIMHPAIFDAIKRDQRMRAARRGVVYPSLITDCIS